MQYQNFDSWKPTERPKTKGKQDLQPLRQSNEGRVFGKLDPESS